MAISHIAATKEEADAVARALLEERRRLQKSRELKQFDGRTRLGRRMRSLQQRYSEEAAQARGIDVEDLTDMDRALVHRASFMTISIERLEVEMLRGEPIARGDHARMSNQLRLMLKELRMGDQAIARIEEDDDGPSIAEIAARHRHNKEEAL